MAKYSYEEDPLGAFKSGEGNSSEEEKIEYKRMRGETLSAAEEKIWRAMHSLSNSASDEYDVAPY